MWLNIIVHIFNNIYLLQIITNLNEIVYACVLYMLIMFDSDNANWFIVFII